MRLTSSTTASLKIRSAKWRKLSTHATSALTEAKRGRSGRLAFLEIVHVNQLRLCGDRLPIAVLEFLDENCLAKLEGENTLAFGWVEKYAHVTGVRAQGGEEDRGVLVWGSKNGLTVRNDMENVVLSLGHPQAALSLSALDARKRSNRASWLGVMVTDGR